MIIRLVTEHFKHFSVESQTTESGTFDERDSEDKLCEAASPFSFGTTANTTTTTKKYVDQNCQKLK